MPETPHEYRRRMLGQVEGRNAVQLQSAAPKKLERLVKGVSAGKLRKRPAPAKWSIAEIVAHLADTELVVGYRIRMILGAPGTPIQAFDQDAWAAALGYGERDVRVSLAQFRALREANLRLLKSLKKEHWKHYGLHAERGEESVETIVQMMAGHDLNHIAQIERILAPKK
jgi:DinB superfamily